MNEANHIFTLFLNRVLLKKSGCRTPRIELDEIGPSFDFVLRRTHLASDDLYKTAHRQPKALKVDHEQSHIRQNYYYLLVL